MGTITTTTTSSSSSSTTSSTSHTTTDNNTHTNTETTEITSTTPDNTTIDHNNESEVHFHRQKKTDFSDQSVTTSSIPFITKIAPTSKPYGNIQTIQRQSGIKFRVDQVENIVSNVGAPGLKSEQAWKEILHSKKWFRREDVERLRQADIRQMENFYGSYQPYTPHSSSRKWSSTMTGSSPGSTTGTPETRPSTSTKLSQHENNLNQRMRRALQNKKVFSF